MINDELHIDNLIARYLSGEASASERKKLERWMDESEDNKHYFADIRFVHDKAVASHHIVKVDVDGAWNKVKAQMKTSEAGKVIPVRRSTIQMSFLWKAAAIVVFAMGVSLLLYKNYQSNIYNAKDIAIASNDSTLNYQLSDSTQVFLNKKATIAFARSYGNKQREVDLTGEAYFDVRHMADKPFVVSACGALVKDIGTSFNVTAYPDSNLVKVFVESGEVLFYTSSNAGIRLTEGESGIFDKTTKAFAKLSVRDANVLSYKTRVFAFQNAPLPEVLEKINAAYHTNIRFESKTLLYCKITVTFDNENIHSIVTVIAETLGLKVTETNDGYLLEGNGCSNL